jgi:hypothetical protein
MGVPAGTLIGIITADGGLEMMVSSALRDSVFASDPAAGRGFKV